MYLRKRIKMGKTKNPIVTVSISGEILGQKRDSALLRGLDLLRQECLERHIDFESSTLTFTIAPKKV
jgi:hypothetical protein